MTAPGVLGVGTHQVLCEGRHGDGGGGGRWRETVGRNILFYRLQHAFRNAAAGLDRRRRTPLS